VARPAGFERRTFIDDSAFLISFVPFHRVFGTCVANSISLFPIPLGEKRSARHCVGSRRQEGRQGKARRGEARKSEEPGDRSGSEETAAAEVGIAQPFSIFA